ncbi:MAG: hypothetical protein Q8O42_15105 [Acidobacteriota bacterium]|nr:hypothetical protein [Acidobacteriota bacterium]
MKQMSYRLAGLALAVAMLTGGVAPVSTQTNVPGIDKPVIVVTGEINGTVNWTSNFYYVLRGAVFVNDGGTLNIAAGTRVIGEAGSVGTLIVLRGGRLNAIGTRTAPIVFTSDQAPGNRARGDWGGMILNGRAPVNLEGGEGAGEGDTGVYGGNNPNDSSGTMRYVRVEYGGTEFSPDNELNGIAFQGVGRGGSYEYIQVHMARDDGLEWFGGTADIKYAVVSNAADDSFDWTFGWSGRAQFIAITQRGDDADNGIEADNNEFNNNLLPRSNPQIYNITLCGDPDRNEGGEGPRGANFRRGTAFTVRNFLVTGFKNVGFQISDASTSAQVTNGTSHMGAGVAWGMPTNMHSSVMAFITGGQFPNIRVGATDAEVGISMAGCSNHENPNFQPTGVATLAGGQIAPIQPPNDGFFEAVTFIGAVPPVPADNWMTGWTEFAQR